MMKRKKMFLLIELMKPYQLNKNMLYKRRIDLMRYLFMISHESPFIIWRFTFHITETKLYLYYKQNSKILYSVELSYDFESMERYWELKKVISEFVVDCYYNHEWNWKELSYNTLKALLWIASEWVVVKKLFDIKKRIASKISTLKRDHGISLIDR